MADEYIKRSDAIKEISKAPAYFDNSDVQYGLVLAESIIEDIPAADVVEVVRCKDCKYFSPYEGEEHKGDCAELVGLESCVYEDDFCSYGEKKAD